MYELKKYLTDKYKFKFIDNDKQELLFESDKIHLTEFANILREIKNENYIISVKLFYIGDKFDKQLYKLILSELESDKLFVILKEKNSE